MNFKKIFWVLFLTLFATQIFAEVSYVKLMHKTLVNADHYETKDDIESEMVDMIEEKQFKKISDRARKFLKSEEYSIDGKFKHTSFLDSFLAITNR